MIAKAVLLLVAVPLAGTVLVFAAAHNLVRALVERLLFLESL